MRRDDPYYDNYIYHWASKINSDGDVSALCYVKPRAINYARGQSWTNREEAVTCPRCRRLLRAKKEGARTAGP